MSKRRLITTSPGQVRTSPRLTRHLSTISRCSSSNNTTNRRLNSSTQLNKHYNKHTSKHKEHNEDD